MLLRVLRPPPAWPLLTLLSPLLRVLRPSWPLLTLLLLLPLLLLLHLLLLLRLLLPLLLVLTLVPPVAWPPLAKVSTLEKQSWRGSLTVSNTNAVEAHGIAASDLPWPIPCSRPKNH